MGALMSTPLSDCYFSTPVTEIHLLLLLTSVFPSGVRRSIKEPGLDFSFMAFLRHSKSKILDLVEWSVTPSIPE